MARRGCKNDIDLPLGQLRLRKKDKCHIAADGMLLVLDEVMPYIRCYVGYREAMDKPSQSEKED